MAQQPSIAISRSSFKLRLEVGVTARTGSQLKEMAGKHGVEEPSIKMLVRSSDTLASYGREFARLFAGASQHRAAWSLRP